MNKVSRAEIAEVLREVPAVLRDLVDENSALKEKLAQKDQRERVQKLAADMHRKGLHVDIEPDALADQLEKDAAQGKSLDVIERAVDLVGPDMGRRLAQLDTDAAVPLADFERFLMEGA